MIYTQKMEKMMFKYSNVSIIAELQRKFPHLFSF